MEDIGEAVPLPCVHLTVAHSAKAEAFQLDVLVFNVEFVARRAMVFGRCQGEL